jgi:hypothetical protein
MLSQGGLFAALCLSACAGAPTSIGPGGAITPPGVATPASFTDPFAYCAAVGSLDSPDARYTGPQVPEAIAQGLKQAMQLPSSAPIEPLRHLTIWRCMDGKVYACNRGANIPCEEKANTERTPSAEMKEFCSANPTAEFIPAAVTGRATVYQWSCVNGQPSIAKQLAQPDARGFISSFWYTIEK